VSTRFEHRLYPTVDAADQERCRPDFAIAVYPGHLWKGNKNLGLNPTIPVTSNTPPTFLLQAEYSTKEVDTDRVDRGFRIERVVKNLSDSSRVGTSDAPLKLGDQLLITYRLNTRKLQNFVALEDALPAGLEVVNPNLALVGKFFQLPPADPQDRMLGLSYSEMRDRSALLYFDTVDPGSGTYSILARATAAGTFRWPATQVAPMYDSRFSGLSSSSLCVISAD